MCKILGVQRSAYYRWLKNPESLSERTNNEITKKILEVHKKHPDMGYRRIRDELNAKYGMHVNDKRIRRICRKKGIYSKIKWKPKACTINARNPYQTAENVLNRDFEAEAPNLKWVTDVTEFKYYEGPQIKKVYLSAFLDLYDHRIVSYVISDHNDNPLVMNTFDQAMEKNPGAHPLIHSDRGFQYTSYEFAKRIEMYQMTRSMSRVGKCIDNAPMEGFWGILKRESYYGFKFHSREEIITMIEGYIEYYNNERIQRKLGKLAPNQYHYQYLESIKNTANSHELTV